MEVEFAGFRSDTYTLQRQGWVFSANQELMHRRIRVLGRHDQFDLSLYAEGSEFDFDMFRSRNHPMLQIRWVRPTKNVIVRETLDMRGFNPVDMTPQYITESERRLSDFPIFAPLVQPAREIIVEPKDVQECLNLIERLQAPQLAEIRKRNARREQGEAIQRGTVHAQVIALAA